jgi:hypothetical protein
MSEAWWTPCDGEVERCYEIKRLYRRGNQDKGREAIKGITALSSAPLAGKENFATILF